MKFYYFAFYVCAYFYCKAIYPAHFMIEITISFCSEKGCSLTLQHFLFFLFHLYFKGYLHRKPYALFECNDLIYDSILHSIESLVFRFENSFRFKVSMTFLLFAVEFDGVLSWCQPLVPPAKKLWKILFLFLFQLPSYSRLLE